jgi:hypothetical protein
LRFSRFEGGSGDGVGNILRRLSFKDGSGGPVTKLLSKRNKLGGGVIVGLDFDGGDGGDDGEKENGYQGRWREKYGCRGEA